ncbi:VOC family protein [Candidatus Saccharibacteria bacterium]|nr:VOC family protein [Candidatus Saccharibacteria bacterium]
MQKITPNLWFDGAREAVDFYVSAFPDGKILSVANYPESAEEGLADFQQDLAGKELSIEFELGGMHFTAINAGPAFTPNPSISFMVNFDPSRDEQAREHLDELWAKLSEGGQVLMPLDTYDFSQHYGWVQDRFNISWQLMLTDPAGEPRPFIVPALMFIGDNNNRAEEALNHYVSIFKDAKAGTLARYPDDTGPAKAGSLMYGEFAVGEQWFAVMDSGVEHQFNFNEGISLSISCRDQAEIDYFWEKLSTVPEAEQCGWCKDQFGVSWQVVPENMEELMSRPGAFAKMMEMHKLVIADF